MRFHEYFIYLIFHRAVPLATRTHLLVVQVPIPSTEQLQALMEVSISLTSAACTTKNTSVGQQTPELFRLASKKSFSEILFPRRVNFLFLLDQCTAANAVFSCEGSRSTRGWFTRRCVYSSLCPTIAMLLQLLATWPVTTCSCERSISALRRLKTYLRSTMQQERFVELGHSPCSWLQRWADRQGRGDYSPLIPRRNTENYLVKRKRSHNKRTVLL